MGGLVGGGHGLVSLRVFGKKGNRHGVLPSQSRLLRCPEKRVQARRPTEPVPFFRVGRLVCRVACVWCAGLWAISVRVYGRPASVWCAETVGAPVSLHHINNI